MKPLFPTDEKSSCTCGPQTDCCSSPPGSPLPMAGQASDDAPCCGPAAGPPSSPFERPGYTLCHFVDGFEETLLEPVPRLKTKMQTADRLGVLRARLGIARDKYRVAPGLYCVGKPGEESPVFVTANYKLSFDALRTALHYLDGWILVLDTRGVNVWCAAGKKTFSTTELIHQIRCSGLEKVVSHRRLIVPQLGAPGISAKEIAKACGFKVVWGPIRAKDIRVFLENDMQTQPEMRALSFTLPERIVLVPVEISLILKPSLWVLVALFLLSGIGPEMFSITQAGRRFLFAGSAYVSGVFAGAVLAPLLLPWLPGRTFFVKGLLTGAVCALPLLAGFAGKISIVEAAAMALICLSVSSYAAMNFTGATPYTSPSGVEKEMRMGIPLLILMALLALAGWVAQPFMF